WGSCVPLRVGCAAATTRDSSPVGFVAQLLTTPHGAASEERDARCARAWGRRAHADALDAADPRWRIRAHVVATRTARVHCGADDVKRVVRSGGHRDFQAS